MKGSGRPQADQDQYLCDTISGSLPRTLLWPSRHCRTGRSHDDDQCLSQNVGGDLDWLWSTVHLDCCSFELVSVPCSVVGRCR